MSSISGISFGGLASGLDTGAIIKSLVALERRPITLLQLRKRKFSQQKSLFGDLDSKLKKLSDAAKALQKSKTFLDFKAATDDEDKFLTATAGSGATAGSYKIEIQSLAQARTRRSKGSVDRNQQTHGSGLLKFTIGGKDELVSIGANSTLDSIAGSINAASIGITASVVDTGKGDKPFKLVLTSDEPGSDNDFDVSVDDANAALTAFAGDLQGDNSTAATNAKLSFNGVDVERSTNTITDLIPGVTLNLKGAHTSPASTTLTISTDTEKTADKIKSFVDAYNDIVDFISTQQSITKGKGGAAASAGKSKNSGSGDNDIKTNPLFGDSTISTIRRGLRSILGGSVDTGNQSYSLLAQAGIKADRDGKLTFSRTDFEEALGKDPNAVRALFADDKGGIAGRVFDAVDSYTDPIDGLLVTRTKGIDRTVKDINRTISRTEDRVGRFEEQLTRRFSNLELLMGRLQSQAGALNSLR